jgi:hypothetical protein
MWFHLDPMPKRPSISDRPSPIDRALQSAIVALQMQRPDEAERIAAGVLKTNRSNTVAAQILAVRCCCRTVRVKRS